MTNQVKVVLTGEASALTAATDKAKRSIAGVGDAAESAAGPSDKLSAAIGRIGHYAVTAFAVDRVVQFASAIFEASASAQRLATTLNFASGGKAPQELAFLRDLTDKLGLGFSDAARAYASFAAAARGTSLAGQGAKDVFESVAKASATLGLSADDTRGVLLALQQMVSKGVVSAEELRGQMGERLPGAFGAAARAMGVTEAQLGKMLERGEVLATDLLPKLAKVLSEDFANAAETAATRLDAAANKMLNAWERLKQRLGDAGVADGMSALAKAATNDMNAIGEAMALAEKSGRGVFGQWDAGLAMLVGRAFGLQFVADRFNSIGTQADAARARVDELSAKLATLNSYGVTSPGMERGLAGARAEIDRLSRLRQLLNGDDGSAGSDAKFTSGAAAAAKQREAANLADAAVQKVREAAKTDLDVRRKWSDDAVEIAKAFNKKIETESDPTAQIALMRERDSRMVDLARQTNKALLDAANARTAAARALTEASIGKGLQEKQNASDVVLRGLEREQAALDASRAAGLVSAAAYEDGRLSILRREVAERSALIEEEIRAEEKRPTAQGDAAALVNKAKAVLALRGKLAAESDKVPAGKADSRARAEQADIEDSRQRAKDWAQAWAQADQQIAQVMQQTAVARAQAIRDPVAREIALVDLQVSDLLSARDSLIAELRRKADEAPTREAAQMNMGLIERAIASTNDAIVQAQADLTERLKPEWQRMAEDWADSTRQMQEMGMSAMRGIESAIDQMVSTGKLNVKGLVASILADFAKIQLRGLAGSLLGSLFGTSGGPEQLGEGSYGRRAAGGPVSSGQTYLVGERGPELLHMGAMSGRITPNHQIGGGARITMAPVINIDARSDAAQVAQLVAIGMQQAQAGMWEQLRLRGAV